MDIDRCDQLAKAISAAGTRRGALQLLAGLPFGGTLALPLGDEPSEARRRQKGK